MTLEVSRRGTVKEQLSDAATLLLPFLAAVKPQVERSSILKFYEEIVTC